MGYWSVDERRLNIVTPKDPLEGAFIYFCNCFSEQTSYLSHFVKVMVFLKGEKLQTQISRINWFLFYLNV